METTHWLPEHSAVLRDLRARGLSYAQIADAINSKFNTVYTRYAALSRGQRMNLGGLDRPEPSVPGKLEQPKPRESASSVTTRSREVDAELKATLLHRPKFFAKTTKQPRLRCAEVTPRYLSLLELEPKDCRYPYGGDAEGEPVTYCGHRRQLGSSYCPPHLELSRNPVATALPVLDAAWLQVVTKS